ncbi:hypothetical protein CLV63_102445 [Murinocardiopsis flavida]|uniref:DUF917 domain-containing protein n=1 Tax=Murinocardiopsis flavida TaxID=645275 RepID=A0A2P8DSX7_9ACTN|nr:DUF917 domain-containing protein [Murinocardiopsis flavida]PSL00317.1 hypothetical protein CLV63_102445 [Murinocardiopsis flavida]
MTREITSDDVAALAAGAAIFGTGGGGAVTTSRFGTADALRKHGPVRLRTVAELTGQDMVIVMSGIGAPTVGIEMLPSAAQPETLLRETERAAGRRATAVMATEIGGTNGVGPVGWAAQLGLDVLDADGMGRAFPEATMVAMNVAGVPRRLTVLSDVVGNVTVMRTIDATWLERHVRAFSVASGSLCLGASPLYAEDVPGAVIEGTVGRAIEVGHAVLDAAEPVPALAETLGAAVLISGKIIDVARRTEGGFVRGSVTIAGTGTDRDRLLRVELQNENLIVLADGEVLVSVPDLITLVDSETGHAISTELLRFGQRVSVLAWSCDPLWRTERGLDIAGPRAFGYDIDYVPFDAGDPRWASAERGSEPGTAGAVQ